MSIDKITSATFYYQQSTPYSEKIVKKNQDTRYRILFNQLNG